MTMMLTKNNTDDTHGFRLPSSQITPVYSGTHVQVKFRPSSVHVPPLRQGNDMQTWISEVAKGPA